jgi:uncharacterized protein (DUF4415 family)
MKDETFKSGRGGARKGAGRPKSNAPKIAVSFRLAADVVAWLKRQPDGQSPAVERLVRKAMKGLKK